MPRCAWACAKRRVGCLNFTASVGQAASPGEDLIADVAGMLQGKNALLANLAVFKTGERTTGSLLDVLA